MFQPLHIHLLSLFYRLEMKNLSPFPHLHASSCMIFAILVTPFAFPTSKIYCTSISYNFNPCTSTMHAISARFTITHHNLCFHQIHFLAFTLMCTFSTIKVFYAVPPLFPISILCHPSTIFIVTCPLLSRS